MKRRRGRVIRNFTEKTATQSVMKAAERMQQLDAENQELRAIVGRCLNLLEEQIPLTASEWEEMRRVMRDAIGADAEESP